MVVAGIDVGSLNVGVVLLQDDRILSYGLLSSSEGGAIASQKAVAQAIERIDLPFTNIGYAVSTGCGRNSVPFANKQSSEVVCQAKGAFFLFPSARMVLNLGAESSRAIRLNETGKVQSFAANDKCAAGSGLFLETMAKLLEVSLEKMGEIALKAEHALGARGDVSIEYDEDGDALPATEGEVSSRCAVFAESEVISHIHKGVPKENILVGLHKAVVDRILEIAGRVGIEGDVVVTGGVARNVAIINDLEQRMGLRLMLPEQPQIVGALGAALVAKETSEQVKPL